MWGGLLERRAAREASTWVQLGVNPGKGGWARKQRRTRSNRDPPQRAPEGPAPHEKALDRRSIPMMPGSRAVAAAEEDPLVRRVGHKFFL